FSPRLRGDHVWSAFVILALIRDARAHRRLLRVPHTGEQRVRFNAAMHDRNLRIIALGQREIQHHCKGCMRIYEEKEEGTESCQPVVSDGLTIGHPCCKTFRCTKSLDKIRNHWCPGCAKLCADQCAVENCVRKIVPTDNTKMTCDDETHVEMERKTVQRGQSMFVLTSRLTRSRISAPDFDAETDDDALVWYEVDALNRVTQRVDSHPVNVGVSDADADRPDRQIKPASAPALCPSKTPKRQRILLARRRTACEVTLIRPCGIILQRATMFGAEAVSNVLKMTKTSFSVPGARKPEMFIYDTACEAKQQAMNLDDDWWDDVHMVVDPWHLVTKHKTTHDFCQKYCNPASYPELMREDGKGWWFNTSVAEQTNVWLGSYHSILKEMLPIKYNFFLDEMIRLKNIDTIQTLKDRRLMPMYYPSDTEALESVLT
ncbi:hypothetical protein CONPUDRAFT_44027, partial [Coniophora puteana RWD-64-598 SS2]